MASVCGAISHNSRDRAEAYLLVPVIGQRGPDPIGLLRAKATAFDTLRQPALVVEGIQVEDLSPLLEVGPADNRLPHSSRFLQCRHEKGNEKGNDRDNHQQFDEREAHRTSTLWPRCALRHHSCPQDECGFRLGEPRPKAGVFYPTLPRQLRPAMPPGRVLTSYHRRLRCAYPACEVFPVFRSEPLTCIGHGLVARRVCPRPLIVPGAELGSAIGQLLQREACRRRNRIVGLRIPTWERGRTDARNYCGRVQCLGIIGHVA